MGQSQWNPSARGRPATTVAAIRGFLHAEQIIYGKWWVTSTEIVTEMEWSHSQKAIQSALYRMRKQGQVQYRTTEDKGRPGRLRYEYMYRDTK